MTSFNQFDLFLYNVVMLCKGFWIVLILFYPDDEEKYMNHFSGRTPCSRSSAAGSSPARCKSNSGRRCCNAEQTINHKHSFSNISKCFNFKK